MAPSVPAEADLRLAARDTSPGSPGEERRRGFALSLGVGGGGWFVFEDVVRAHEGEGLGVGPDEAGACGVDALHA